MQIHGTNIVNEQTPWISMRIDTGVDEEGIMKELDTLYRQIQPNIYAFFYVKTSNQAVAEDLTQDVFYEACKGIKSFKGKSTLKTWLFSIATNVLRKYYRSTQYERNVNKQLKQTENHLQQTPEQTVIIDDEMQTLLQLINRLDDANCIIKRDKK